MTRSIPNGVYSASITARSRDVPSPADDLTYSVAVYTSKGKVTFDGVAPAASKRWTNKMPLGTNGEIPELYPFEIDEIVILHVQGTETRRQMFIGEGEVPAFGGCPE